VPFGVVFDWAELSAEQRVDERGLAQSALAYNHDCKVRATLGYNFVPLETCAQESALHTATRQHKERDLPGSADWQCQFLQQ